MTHVSEKIALGLIGSLCLQHCLFQLGCTLSYRPFKVFPVIFQLLILSLNFRYQLIATLLGDDSFHLSEDIFRQPALLQPLGRPDAVPIGHWTKNFYFIKKATKDISFG